jgi:plasmid stabilization system protein ParE
MLVWSETTHGAEAAAYLMAQVAEAVERAASHPNLHAWVGSVHPSLDVLPRDWRRVLSRSRRHVVYYRTAASGSGIEILAVRGAGQLPPLPEELRA